MRFTSAGAPVIATPTDHADLGAFLALLLDRFYGQLPWYLRAAVSKEKMRAWLGIAANDVASHSGL